MKNIFERLKEDYFTPIGKVLQGSAETASVFPNRPDIGSSREKVYYEFLKQHLPSQCNINYGGYLFNYDGLESKQIDLFVTTDLVPQFNFFSSEYGGKTFAPVEGTSAVVSIKSNLDNNQLIDTIENINSIPFAKKGSVRLSPYLNIPNDLDDYLLYKIIVAFDGVGQDSIKSTLENYFDDNNIPISRQPNLIHVVGKYTIIRAVDENLVDSSGETIPVGNFVYYDKQSDVIGLLYAILGIQESSFCFNHLAVRYQDILNNMFKDTRI